MNDHSPARARSLATMKAGAAALLPIYPETFEDVVRLARMSIISGMIKPIEKGYGERKEVETDEAMEARATMTIMQGMELGLPPMQAIQLIALINGRMTVHSEGVPGILLSKGFKIKQEFVGEQYEDDFAAICTLTRPGGEVSVTKFSVADAKEANLWQTSAKVERYKKGGDKYFTDNDSPWWKYRKRMLWARALGFNAKDAASDAMKGLIVREEVEDMVRSRDAIDITPTEVPKITSAPPILDMLEDEPEETEMQEVEEMDDRFAPDQEAAFLEALHDGLSSARSKKSRQEVVNANIDLLDRLSDEGRRSAEKMMGE